MSEGHPENGEELIDETGRNATQRDMDERGTSDVPAGVEWDRDDD
jgi:hypothetical protein